METTTLGKDGVGGEPAGVRAVRDKRSRSTGLGRTGQPAAQHGVGQRHQLPGHRRVLRQLRGPHRQRRCPSPVTSTFWRPSAAISRATPLARSGPRQRSSTTSSAVCEGCAPIGWTSVQIHSCSREVLELGEVIEAWRRRGMRARRASSALPVTPMRLPCGRIEWPIRDCSRPA